ncbi:hypothetical protein [Microlunatus aurantiacus]
MTTADTLLMSRRSRRQQTRADSRTRTASLDGPPLERQLLLLSLTTVACVALTLFFLRLGIPGAAFVFLGLGVLLLSRGHPE